MAENHRKLGNNLIKVGKQSRKSITNQEKMVENAWKLI